MKYMKLGSKPDAFQNDGNNIRFVATELATDITVNVGDVKFFLHKFPLLSKSSRLQKLVSEAGDDTIDEIDVTEIPGGAEAFEICVKFCYGMTVTLNAYNVVAARCAADFLEMHETVDKGNLIYKIEVFLNSSVFNGWKDSIIVLQTTKPLLPWSEDLKVVSHCIESIASKASIDPLEVEWSYSYNRKKLPSENGREPHWNGVMKQQSVPKDWWVEDLCELEIDLYKRVITAIKVKGKLSSRVLGEALRAYTYRRLPGFGKGTISITHAGDMKSRALLETVVWLLPSESGSLLCGFLLKLLKAAILLGSSEMCRKELVKRIGRQLHEASVSDLVIPAPIGEETVCDVDMVMSMVEEFLMQGHGGSQASSELQEVRNTTPVATSSKVAVAKLVDGYLSEIAKDPSLPLSKFVELAEMVTESSRPVHDGIYRAIDMYLKEHPDLSKGEKKRLCGLMDCKRLSAEACMHAVQNERLPLRVVVQVLFFEQVRAAAVAGGTSDSARSLLLPRENGGSHGSSRSAVTSNTTEDDWDSVPTSARRLSSIKPSNLAGSVGSSGSSEANKNGDDKGSGGRAKGIKMPKKILSKLWSGKTNGGENSSSDTSESPAGSINPEEAKSTPSRNIRHSVS